MDNHLTRAAIIYDFDGTLAPGNMQEHTFLPEHGETADAFWARAKAVSQREDADAILVYMQLMLQLARSRHTSITKASLVRHGNVPLFEGVETWFDRIDAEGRKQGLEIDHYVVSSGLREMIEGCRIAKRFTKIFGSSFVYDDKGDAVWPGIAINYTTKTQHLFRISKGIGNTWDNDRINRWVPMEERPLPFHRMIFIGDGATDIPSMEAMRAEGGSAIAVYDPKRWSEESHRGHVYRLIAEDRAHFVAPADYTEGSQLDVTVRGVLGRIAREAGFRERR